MRDVGKGDETMSRKRMGVVYKITNRNSKRVYVGQTMNPASRWLTHREELMKGTHHNQEMQDDYNHAVNPLTLFSFEIVEEVLITGDLKNGTWERKGKDDALDHAECRILNNCGGYKSKKTYNMIQGGRFAYRRTQERKERRKQKKNKKKKRWCPRLKEYYWA